MKRLFTLIVILALAIRGYAQAPQKMSYQCVVRNSSGALVTNHSAGIRITVLQGSTSGTVVYQETFNSLTNANGLASIEIGSGTPVSGSISSINWMAGPYYLRTETDPAGGTSYTISGASQLLSVPYALFSNTAGDLADNSVTSAKILNATIATVDLSDNSVTSLKVLDGNIVTADLADNTVSNSKLGNLAVSADKIQTGAVITAKITDAAVTSAKIADGSVSKAKLSATGGSSGQVLKLQDGVLAWGPDNTELTLPYSGNGSTIGNTDLFYVINTGTGRAIHAVAAGNTAVWGASTSGYAGVDGRNTAGIGVSGHSVSNSGVYGHSDDHYGVFGHSGLTGGRFEGVSTGVYGISTGAAGINFGVYGKTNSPAGYAGYFEGNVKVTGTLSKGGGSFEIDHPLDPANKILRHSFVESPDMMNVYNGNIRTDVNGRAEVILPEYFEALNRDFRYQLTVIGEFAQAIISGEISDNRFTIRTDKPNVKVSWQVTGVRKDPWAGENRIVVEEEKNQTLQGHYLYPELYVDTVSRSTVQ